MSQIILGKTSVHYAAEKGYKDIIQLFSLHAISSVCDQDEFGKHWNIRKVKLLKKYKYQLVSTFLIRAWSITKMYFYSCNRKNMRLIPIEYNDVGIRKEYKEFL